MNPPNPYKHQTKPSRTNLDPTKTQPNSSNIHQNPQTVEQNPPISQQHLAECKQTKYVLPIYIRSRLQKSEGIPFQTNKLELDWNFISDHLSSNASMVHMVHMNTFYMIYLQQVNQQYTVRQQLKHRGVQQFGQRVFELPKLPASWFRVVK